MPMLRVEALAGQLEHRVGDEVLRAQALFDVREIPVGRLDQVRALAADVGRLAQPVHRERLASSSPPRAGRRA